MVVMDAPNEIYNVVVNNGETYKYAVRREYGDVPADGRSWTWIPESTIVGFSREKD